MGRTAVVAVEAVQEGAQQTALWGADAHHAGGGEVGAKSHSLGSVGEKVLYLRGKKPSVTGFVISVSGITVCIVYGHGNI